MNTKEEEYQLDFLQRLYAQHLQKGERREAEKVKDKYFDFLTYIQERKLKKWARGIAITNGLEVKKAQVTVGTVVESMPGDILYGTPYLGIWPVMRYKKK